MEKKAKEIQVKKIVETYVAIDGVEFENREECEKYENSAICAANKRLEQITVAKKGEYNQESTFMNGDYECKVQIVVPKNSEDIDAINKFVAVTNDMKSNNTKGLITDECIGQHVILCFNFDDDYVWMFSEKEIKEHWDKIFSL